MEKMYNMKAIVISCRQHLLRMKGTDKWIVKFVDDVCTLTDGPSRQNFSLLLGDVEMSCQRLMQADWWKWGKAGTKCIKLRTAVGNRMICFFVANIKMMFYQVKYCQSGKQSAWQCDTWSFRACVLVLFLISSSSRSIKHTTDDSTFSWILSSFIQIQWRNSIPPRNYVHACCDLLLALFSTINWLFTVFSS